MTYHDKLMLKILVLAWFVVLWWSYLSGVPDAIHERALRDIQEQSAAAQKACFPAEAWEWIDERSVQCYTHRGTKTKKAEAVMK
jgi:hypothetical protein